MFSSDYGSDKWPIGMSETTKDTADEMLAPQNVGVSSFCPPTVYQVIEDTMMTLKKTLDKAKSQENIKVVCTTDELARGHRIIDTWGFPGIGVAMRDYIWERVSIEVKFAALTKSMSHDLNALRAYREMLIYEAEYDMLLREEMADVTPDALITNTNNERQKRLVKIWRYNDSDDRSGFPWGLGSWMWTPLMMRAVNNPVRFDNPLEGVGMINDIAEGGTWEVAIRRRLDAPTKSRTIKLLEDARAKGVGLRGQDIATLLRAIGMLTIGGEVADSTSEVSAYLQFMVKMSLTRAITNIDDITDTATTAIAAAANKLSQYTGTTSEKIKQMVVDHVRYALRARRDHPLVVVDAGSRSLGLTLRSSTVAHVLLGVDGRPSVETRSDAQSGARGRDPNRAMIDEDTIEALVGEDTYQELKRINGRALHPLYHMKEEVERLNSILGAYSFIGEDEKNLIIAETQPNESYQILVGPSGSSSIQSETNKLLDKMNSDKTSLDGSALALDSQRTGVYLNKYAIDYATVVTAPVVYHYSVLGAALSTGGANILDDPQTLTRTIGDLIGGSDTLTLELELAVER